METEYQPGQNRSSIFRRRRGSARVAWLFVSSSLFGACFGAPVAATISSRSPPASVAPPPVAAPPVKPAGTQLELTPSYTGHGGKLSREKIQFDDGLAFWDGESLIRCRDVCSSVQGAPNRDEVEAIIVHRDHVVSLSANPGDTSISDLSAGETTPRTLVKTGPVGTMRRLLALNDAGDVFFEDFPQSITPNNGPVALQQHVARLRMAVHGKPTVVDGPWVSGGDWFGPCLALQHLACVRGPIASLQWWTGGASWTWQTDVSSDSPLAAGENEVFFVASGHGPVGRAGVPPSQPQEWPVPLPVGTWSVGSIAVAGDHLWLSRRGAVSSSCLSGRFVTKLTAADGSISACVAHEAIVGVSAENLWVLQPDVVLKGRS